MVCGDCVGFGVVGLLWGVLVWLFSWGCRFAVFGVFCYLVICACGFWLYWMPCCIATGTLLVCSLAVDLLELSSLLRLV